MNSSISDILDLKKFPIDRPHSNAYSELLKQCQNELNTTGMFNLHSFLKSAAIKQCISQLHPIICDSFRHQRKHNIYFKKSISGLAKNHPALGEGETKNSTLCADQLQDNLITQVYDYPPLTRFIADVLCLPKLYTMADPLARLNIMTYSHGDKLDWHFDRSEFTVTLLLQPPNPVVSLYIVQIFDGKMNPIMTVLPSSF